MKVAVCGAWHVHAYHYTLACKEDSDTEILGLYDEDEVLKNEFAKSMDIKTFDTFEDLLASDAEGVIVCTSTDTHAYYMERIAAAGKHIFTEKILAPSIEECERIKKAVEDNGVRFVISFPNKYTGAIKAIIDTIDSGELGKVNFVRYRNCHGGAFFDWLPERFFNRQQCGGGAMIDLGAHGMYLINMLLGLPEKFTSVFNVWAGVKKNADKVEDSAVTVMSYADGAIAINETGFVNSCDLNMIEVSGDCGCISYCPERGVEKKTSATEYALVKVEQKDDDMLPINQFLTNNILDGCGIDEGIQLTKMMIGAYSNII